MNIHKQNILDLNDILLKNNLDRISKYIHLLKSIRLHKAVDPEYNSRSGHIKDYRK